MESGWDLWVGGQNSSPGQPLSPGCHKNNFQPGYYNV